MEVFDAARTLLAVRRYRDEPVPQEVIQRILDAGRLTGSSQNRQPWHFIVIQQRETLVQLGALAPSGRYIAEAALAVVVAIARSPFAVSDGSRAIQSMMLAAWSAGVGSNWVGFMGPAEVKPLLGIPEELDVLALVPFGYPADAIGRGQKTRKPLGQVAHRGRFGTAWDESP